MALTAVTAAPARRDRERETTSNRRTARRRRIGRADWKVIGLGDQDRDQEGDREAEERDAGHEQGEHRDDRDDTDDDGARGRPASRGLGLGLAEG
jgi:hypothetical protein